MAEEKLIGKIIHFYGNIQVAILELTAPLNVGDTIKIKGHGGEFEQPVDSIQVEHKDIESAKAGDAVGLKVIQKVKENDEVYKIN